VLDVDRQAAWRDRIKLAGCCVFCGANLYVFFGFSAIVGLLMLPISARWASRYMVSLAIDDMPRWGRMWTYRGWNGDYREFDGQQLRIDDFDDDLDRMPLIAAADLENLFKDRARFRIKGAVAPASGLLQDIAAIPADRAVTWARMIANTRNHQADRALQLALYLERSLLLPREKAKCMDAVRALEDREGTSSVP